jgi:NADH dehydrogenase/NADH:ubiquinone oxidoreductase subunit G
MLTRRCLFLLTLALALCPARSVAQAQRSAETTAEVPALDSFHEVIFKIWHEGWPEKKTSMLRELVPEVEKGITGVASAQLPGILREKRAAWEEGVKKLQMAGAAYKAAAEAKDDAALLASAENLHSRFEALMRITRPALKELDEFHAVLYMLYHHYLPDYEIDNIRSSAVELKQKMAVLNDARLPERFRRKEAEFQTARAKLSASVDALESKIQSNDDRGIQAAVSELHSCYQALAGIFE